ncbi:hypothetical protein DERP_010239 [Dermatophagoides pteronyssinus]|uniref:Uncharacterized protein n=1 Tax=Dermatophagoides pteronyssinus TaxID=6956 RepID=A0ABQ8J759_DERPT|nr:hypothetical protein DERP_010239 [Dermatophagoides pteronyssinus]
MLILFQWFLCYDKLSSILPTLNDFDQNNLQSMDMNNNCRMDFLYIVNGDFIKSKYKISITMKISKSTLMNN